jgi:4-amino-4-deoxy-L-arabinose transferase-like glycosyltransferase
MTQAAASRYGAIRVWPLVALGLYLGAMAVQAALLAPVGRSDDLEALLMSQSLDWGYEAKNPPLFYWLAHLATEVTGRMPVTVFGLRFFGLFLAFAGLYALACRLQPDPLLAGCAGFAVLAMVHFHWYPLFHLTNTVYAMALMPVAVLALFRLEERPGPLGWLGFGVAIGLGLLARYNFAIVAVALVAAALTLPAWRARLLRPQALLAVAAVLLLVGPHVAWVAEHSVQLRDQVGRQLVDAADSYGARVAEGSRELLVATLSILAFPLGLLALVCFPRAFRPARVADPARAGRIALVGRTVVIALGLFGVYVLLGADYVQEHHLFVLTLAPVWLIGRLDPRDARQRMARIFAGALAGIAGLAAVVYPIDHRRDAADCDTCAQYQPMADYAAALRAAGFERGTIHALSPRQVFPAPALLGFFPDARMTAADYTVHEPPAGPVPGACLLVWGGSDPPPSLRGDGPVPGIGLPLPATAVTGAAGGRLHLSGRPAGGIGWALVPEGLGACR